MSGRCSGLGAGLAINRPQPAGSLPAVGLSGAALDKLFTHMWLLSPSRINLEPAQAGKVTVGLASHWPCVTDVFPPAGLRLTKGDEPAASLRSSRVCSLYLYLGGIWYILVKKLSIYPLLLSNNTGGLWNYFMTILMTVAVAVRILLTRYKNESDLKAV